MPDRRGEASYPPPVAGVDEAGRGPWAGPVVAAAVVLGLGVVPAARIDDSKRLSRAARDAAFDAIMALAKSGEAAVGIGQASVAEIDRINILQATFLAMRRALGALALAPGFALIDGNLVPDGLPCPSRAVVGGDGSELLIAAASIVAKVTRDRLMAELAMQNPGYGWERNQGYGTAEHRQALVRLGPTTHHRLSFRPLKACVYVAEKSHESVI